MIEFKETENLYTYLGLKHVHQSTNFRRKSFQDILSLANKWMKDHYKEKFLGFKFRSDFDNVYMAKIKELHPIGTHLLDTCIIFKIGTQWKAVLNYTKII